MNRLSMDKFRSILKDNVETNIELNKHLLSSGWENVCDAINNIDIRCANTYIKLFPSIFPKWITRKQQLFADIMEDGEWYLY